MNKSIIDFTKGVKSINLQKYRSKPLVNMDNDMVKITIILKIKENRELYNALRCDNE